MEQAWEFCAGTFNKKSAKACALIAHCVSKLIPNYGNSTTHLSNTLEASKFCKTFFRGGSKDRNLICFKVETELSTCQRKGVSKILNERIV